LSATGVSRKIQKAAADEDDDDVDANIASDRAFMARQRREQAEAAAIAATRATAEQAQAHGEDWSAFAGLSEDAKKSAKMISEMLQEAVSTLDAEQVHCQASEAKAQELLESARSSMSQDQQRLASIAQATQSLGSMQDRLDDETQRLESALSHMNSTCAAESSEWTSRLLELAADEKAVHEAMEKSPCKAVPAVSFLQMSESFPRFRGNAAWLAEAHLGTSPSMALLLGLKMRSPGGRQAMQMALSELASHMSTGGASRQGHRPHRRRLVLLERRGRRRGRRGSDGQDEARVRLCSPGLPGCPMPLVCDNPGKKDCQLAVEAVSILAAELQDRQQEVRQALADHSASCKRAMAGYIGELGALARQREQIQVASANNAARRVAAEEESRLMRQELLQANVNAMKVREDCAASTKALEQKACDARQLRSQVLAVGSAKADVRDCMVSPWVPEPCSATCGGGTQRLTRRVVSPAGPLGASCPPLVATRTCGSQPCPMDCVMSDWGEWTTCTAACGGGTQTRMRSVLTQAAHGGEPCPEETSVSNQCNMQSCDAVACRLSDWSDWSTCSRGCGGGLKLRERRLVGDGTCDEEDTPEEHRRQYLSCNTKACPSTAAKPLKCSAKVDIVLVLDGSGGCAEAGFEATKAFALQFVSALDMAADKVQLGLVVAGGPANWDAYKGCLAGSSLTGCNVRLALQLSADGSAANTAVSGLKWPGSPADVSGALSVAGAALAQEGRQDAEQIVLVMTRGRPLSRSRTALAASSLRRAGRRVAWLLLADGMNQEDIAQWASQPTRDNVFLVTPKAGAVKGQVTIEKPKTKISELLTALCPSVVVE